VKPQREFLSSIAESDGDITSVTVFYREGDDIKTAQFCGDAWTDVEVDGCKELGIEH